VSRGSGQTMCWSRGGNKLRDAKFVAWFHNFIREPTWRRLRLRPSAETVIRHGSPLCHRGNREQHQLSWANL